MGEGWDDGVMADLKQIVADIHEIKITLTRQAGHLEEHMRRTDLAEQRLTTFEKEIIPLKQHVALWGSLGKILAALATAAGLLATVMKLVGK